jgi:hypothetical protein
MGHSGPFKGISRDFPDLVVPRQDGIIASENSLKISKN